MDELHRELMASQPNRVAVGAFSTRPILSYDAFAQTHAVSKDNLMMLEKPLWDGIATALKPDDERAVVAAFAGPYSHEQLVDISRKSRLTRLGVRYSPDELRKTAFGDDPAMNARIAADDYAVMRFLLFDSPKTPLRPSNPRGTDSALAMCIDSVFYTRLAETRGTSFSVANQPLSLQVLMHELAHRIAMENFWEAGRQWIAAGGGAASSSSSSVLDALFLLARADMSCVPLMPEVATAMLDAYYMTALTFSGLRFGQQQDPEPLPLGEPLGAAFAGDAGESGKASVREVFSYIGLIATEVAVFVMDQPTWHAAAHFNAEMDRIRATTTLTQTVVMQKYGSTEWSRETRGSQRHARATTSLAFQALGPLLARSPSMTEAAMETACTIVALNEFVQRRVAPALRTFVADYAMATDWMRFSLDPDFVDNLATLAALFTGDAWLVGEKRDVYRRSRAADIAATAARRDPGVSHWITGERKSAPAWKTIVEKRLNDIYQTATDVDPVVFMRDVIGVSIETVGRINDAIFISAPTVQWNDFDVIEPMVNLYQPNTAVANLRNRFFLLADPQFYLCYLVLRLVYKDRDACLHSKITRAKAMRILIDHMPAIIGFVYGALTRAMSVTPTQIHRDLSPCFRQTAASRPPPTDSVCRNLPRFTYDNRIRLCHTLIHQLELRAGRDNMPAAVANLFTGQQKQLVSLWMDMDRLIAIFIGRAFAPSRLVPAHTAASISVSGGASGTSRNRGKDAQVKVNVSAQTLEMHVRAAGMHISMPETPVSPQYLLLEGVLQARPQVAEMSVEVPTWAKALWLWSPARDAMGRMMFVGKGDAIDVPYLDGLEGLYTCVVGTEELGFALFKRELRLQQRCVRTGVLYEEATNTRTARWVWNGIRYAGWHAPTAVPYVFSLPEDEMEDGVMAPSAVEKWAGDVREKDAVLLTAYSQYPTYWTGVPLAGYRLLMLLSQRAHWPDTQQPPLPGAAIIPPPDLHKFADLLRAVNAVPLTGAPVSAPVSAPAPASVSETLSFGGGAPPPPLNEKLVEEVTMTPPIVVVAESASEPTEPTEREDEAEIKAEHVERDYSLKTSQAEVGSESASSSATSSASRGVPRPTWDAMKAITAALEAVKEAFQVESSNIAITDIMVAGRIQTDAEELVRSSEIKQIVSKASRNSARQFTENEISHFVNDIKPRFEAKIRAIDTMLENPRINVDYVGQIIEIKEGMMKMWNSNVAWYLVGFFMVAMHTLEAPLERERVYHHTLEQIEVFAEQKGGDVENARELQRIAMTYYDSFFQRQRGVVEADLYEVGAYDDFD